MSSELVINATSEEIRVALIENGKLVELHTERSTKGIVGDIYKGIVLKVIPGIQAAFLDIGLERSAFLYVSDIYESFDELNFIEKLEVRKEMAKVEISHPIEDIVKEGQELLVQISKEPIGNKGARVTSNITIPGRYLVLMPFVDHIGVSRRITDENERTRLKEIIRNIKPEGVGFIVRTVSEGEDEEDLKNDMDFLLNIWKEIEVKQATVKAPALIYSDLNVTLRAVRDLYNKEVTKIVVDSKKEYERILEFFHTFMPEVKYSIKLYDESEPIFDYYNIENDINKALGRKVWLKSGGYLIIDHTEALTAIDVNTGKYIGKKNMEDTILQTNLEAVDEIVYQIRLRNIGGIIIIDFIDMENDANRELVYNRFMELLNKDKRKSKILKISEFGLIEMTRERVRENIVRTFCEPCFYCDGKGYVKSPLTICFEIFRELQRKVSYISENIIIINANPEIVELLYEDERFCIEELEKKYRKKILIKYKPNFHQEYFEIYGTNENDN